jgi:hypothetical protein
LHVRQLRSCIGRDVCYSAIVSNGHDRLFVLLRPIVAALLAVSLLFPSIAGAFAAPELSPEQALLRDIGVSLCLESSDEGQKRPSDRSAHDCQNCILCKIPSPNLAREPDSCVDTSIAAFRQPLAAQQWQVPAPHPLASHTGPPRGPPILA